MEGRRCRRRGRRRSLHAVVAACVSAALLVTVLLRSPARREPVVPGADPLLLSLSPSAGLLSRPRTRQLDGAAAAWRPDIRLPARHRRERFIAHATTTTAPPEASTSIHDQQLRASGLEKGERRSFGCDVGGRTLQITYDVFPPAAGVEGSVPTLFLATPSFVPSRATFGDLASAMSKKAGPGGLAAILTELPGYGLNDATLKDLDAYKPELFRGFLQKFLPHVSSEYGKPINVVSAGHAAFYVLDAVKEVPESVGSLFLVNPTYRGPLTTVKMKQKDNPIVPNLVDALCGGIAAAYQLPDPIGNAVHATQCSEGSIKKAMLSHVFEDPTNVTPDAVTINQKFAAEGERWGKCAFLVGRTDPYPRREDAAAFHGSGAPVPTAICVGAKEEDIFRKDLSFLLESGIPMIVTPGAQRNFVEYPEAVAEAAMDFFRKE